MFRELNKLRKAQPAFADWRAGLVARDPTLLAINTTVTRLGLKVSTGKTRKSIAAVKAIISVHRYQKNLGETLRALRDWDLEDPKVFDAQVIKGMAKFLAAYPRADRDRVVTSLRAKTSPSGVYGTANRNKDLGGTFTEAFIAALAGIYNKGLRRGEKLIPLHLTLEEEAA